VKTAAFSRLREVWRSGVVAAVIIAIIGWLLYLLFE